MYKRLSNILIPVIAVILGLIAGAIVMLASGYSPVDGYIALWEGIFSDTYFMGETIRQVTPYILAGLAVAFAFRTGLFNIGVEGQFLMGWLASVWIGTLFTDLPRLIHLPLAVLAAAVAGALWAFIPGLLKAKFRVHEVITTIMMNYISLHVVNYIISNVLTDRSDKTEAIAGSATLRSEFFAALTDNSRMHWGFAIAIAGAIIMWFLLEKTTKGYELKAVGFNQHASEYAGISVNKNIIYAMLISGTFAGLAGAMEGLGTFGYIGVKGAHTGVGFDGIAVALLGANTALGVVLAALLFGGLKYGSLNMPLETGIPTEIIDVVIALIIFFVASSYIIRVVISKFSKKKGVE